MPVMRHMPNDNVKIQVLRSDRDVNHLRTQLRHRDIFFKQVRVLLTWNQSTARLMTDKQPNAAASSRADETSYKSFALQARSEWSLASCTTVNKRPNSSTCLVNNGILSINERALTVQTLN